MKLSVHILAGNCAGTIQRCLNSVKDIAEEIIIVVDTRHGGNSNADTVKIINIWEQANRPVKMYYYDWITDSFADARNYALSKCTGDYIILLDADEEIQNWQFPEIPKHRYYLCSIIKEHCRFKNIRVFRNNCGIYYTGARHNQIANKIDENEIGELPGVIFNGFTIMTEDEVIAKTKGLLKRHMQQLIDEPDNETVNFNIARCHYGLKNWELTKEFCHLALQDSIGNPHRAQVLIYLHIAYLQTARYHAANYWLNMCVNILPDQLWGWCLLYESLFKAGNYIKALEVKKIIESTSISYLPYDMNEEQVINLFQIYNINENAENKIKC